VGNQPREVAFDGSHVWVSNSGSNTVSKIDANTGIVAATIEVSAPFGMAFDGTALWVAMRTSSAVRKIRKTF